MSFPVTAFQPDYCTSTSYSSSPLREPANTSCEALGHSHPPGVRSLAGPPEPHLPLQTQASSPPPLTSFPNTLPKQKRREQTLTWASVTMGGPPPVSFSHSETNPPPFFPRTPSATPPSYTENFGTRHSRPIPRPQTPDPAPLLVP